MIFLPLTVLPSVTQALAFENVATEMLAPTDRFPSPPRSQHPFLTDEQLKVVHEVLDWEVEAYVKDMTDFVTATTKILGAASRSTIKSLNAFLYQQEVKTIPRVFKKRAEMFCKLVMKA
jgi:hypothetical protein